MLTDCFHDSKREGGGEGETKGDNVDNDVKITLTR